mmetsp:Transcript_47828/g.104108  ORF Transcript_47828/g.104108 Transcript_47828/m.104108 type:complete len:287 (+) Transcript_47828:91-951(+)
MRFVLVLALSGLIGTVAHPCEAEISTACPDRPAAEIADCLKKPENHDTVTTLSSECTDFVAINTACSEDINKHCDEAFFSEDTVLCLTTWTEPESLSQKCADVLDWAVPKADDDEGPTDELGMSEKDYEEKKAWQAKRRAERGDPEERKKMKERDAQKERERVELETFKREHPDQYEQMIQMQEEEKRQKAEIKRRERMVQAALERKRQEEEAAAKGAEAEEEEEKKAKKARGSTTSAKKQQSWMPSVLGALLVGFICAAGYYFSKKYGGGGGRKSKKKPLKPKRA